MTPRIVRRATDAEKQGKTSLGAGIYFFLRRHWMAIAFGSIGFLAGHYLP